MNAESPAPDPAWVARWLLGLRGNLPALQREYGLRHLWLIGHGNSEKPPASVHVLAELDRALDYARFTRLQDELSRLLSVTVEVVVRGDLDSEIEALVFPGLLQIF